jgi:hypothetical protein
MACGALILAASGCVSSFPREVVPEPLVNRAMVGELREIRFWGDETSDSLDASLKSAAEQLKTRHLASGKAGAKVRTSGEINFLALSGGGGDGAFGAGLLVGWSQSGTRPSFDIVTGVSTGALMAPFAFLGPSFDGRLRELYTTISTPEVLKSQVIPGLLGGESIADSSPLAKHIAQHVDAHLLQAIAAEHENGRRLFVVTTNLDAERPVVWDMGAIAKVGTPKSVELFREVLLASASIPAVLPPVHISVHADGRKFEEMHVDGGATAQVYFLPPQAPLNYYKESQTIPAKRRLFVIRNAKIAPEWGPVESKTIPIAGRSLNTLIKNQGVSDLYRIYLEAKQNDLEFNLAALPADFFMKNTEAFDTHYMKILFESAQSLGHHGSPWQKAPPGVLVSAARP